MCYQDAQVIRRWSCCPTKMIIGTFVDLLAVVHGPHQNDENWTTPLRNLLCTDLHFPLSITHLIMSY
jgi:hypothetical protein